MLLQAKDECSLMAKQPRKRDPHFRREAAKYKNPIPSREYILELLEQSDSPLNRDQIFRALRLTGVEQQEALFRRLSAMERDGQVIRNRRNDYCPLSRLDLIRGRVVGHPDGFGFLVPEDGSNDLFLSGRQMRGVLHGDKVVTRVAGTDRRGRREGAIVDVLEHANHRVVGRYYSDQGIGFVVADNKRISQEILVPTDKVYGARNGQLVQIQILEYPTRHRQAVGQVIEILGDHMDPGMEIDIAVRAHDLPCEWSPLVEDEISRLGHEVTEEAANEEGRRDIRHLPFVTIDGEESMDFDDAVYCERQGDTWRLVVAIADVSHYVVPSSALDAEARNRGNSVYFPGRVIPMLPEVLSNDLCSLNPGIDRLCMVCDMVVDLTGHMIDYSFYAAVMRSHARLTYTQVAAMLIENDSALRNLHSALVPHLEELYALYGALYKARNLRGAINFDSTATRIIFGAGKKIDAIVPVVRNDAHRLIEECMLIANVAAADLLTRSKLPSLYRVHERPSLEKLTSLREFLSELGLRLKGRDKPQAGDYSELLEHIRGRPDAHLIQTVMLRSMAQAVYSPDNHGHFGLAYDAYTHFTSPIRRYPDLLTHRVIRHLITGQDRETFRYGAEEMVILGEHCSMTERRADEATRDAANWLKCEYMMDKIGKTFDGVISSVTGFGLFVELKDIYVEGLIHITGLGKDYYHFDPAKHRLIGERSHKIFRLGDPIRVRVVRVDLDEKKIDFELASGR